MANQEAKVNINGKEYLLSDLSADAKAQLQSVQFVNAEIQRLNAKLAIAKTAKQAYEQALIANLPQ